MQKILLIGATGLLGQAIERALSGRAQVISASLNHPENPVDISNPDSLQALLDKQDRLDGIICTAGVAYFKPWLEASLSDWQFAVNNKMMGQINLLRLAAPKLSTGGAIILTTGILAQYPMPGSAIVSTVNAAVEAAIKAASLELTDIRINAVSPGWIKETLVNMGIDSEAGLPVAEVAEHYVRLLKDSNTGETLVASKA